MQPDPRTLSDAELERRIAANDLARIWRRIQARIAERSPLIPKPLKLIDKHRLTTEQVWQLWRDGFDVSAELERRMGL